MSLRMVGDTGLFGAVTGTLNGTLGSTAPTTIVTTSVSASGVVGTSETGALIIPTGTTAQRPASPVTGQYRFNTDLNVLEFYNGSDWYSVTAT